MIAQPKKRIREVIREYGGKHHMADRTGDSYIFPDMFVLHVTKNPTGMWVAAQAKNLAHRYGFRQSKELTGLAKVGHAPLLDLENLTASDHAKDRLRLMQSQRTVTFSDVLHALRLPERTLWSEKHESWVWIRHPVAVAVRENYTGRGHTIITVLWSDNELFDLHPRPKETPHGRG